MCERERKRERDHLSMCVCKYEMPVGIVVD